MSNMNHKRVTLTRENQNNVFEAWGYGSSEIASDARQTLQLAGMKYIHGHLQDALWSFLNFDLV